MYGYIYIERGEKKRERTRIGRKLDYFHTTCQSREGAPLVSYTHTHTHRERDGAHKQTPRNAVQGANCRHVRVQHFSSVQHVKQLNRVISNFLNKSSSPYTSSPRCIPVSMQKPRVMLPWRESSCPLQAYP